MSSEKVSTATSAATTAAVSSALDNASINSNNGGINGIEHETRIVGGSGAGGSSGNANAENALRSIEAEYKKHPDRHSWNIYYQEIREKCDREAKEKYFSTSEAKQNSCLNRYRDVNPYNHSRIVLHRGTVDYINANLVKLQRADRKYILTQGPLPHTVGHFWLMVWEQNTRAILMLNKLVEKQQVKCHLYWPDEKGAQHALKLDDVKLKVKFLRHEQYKNYVRRWFKLTDLETQTSREIIQFHYTTWPDFGIPSSPNAFLQFLKQVRDSGALNSDVGPAIVHCSAGIGRSGTFCLVDCCLVLVDKHGECDVAKVLCELRSYRMGLIQTPDQLYFSYQAIIEGIKLLKDPSFLDYSEEPISNNTKNDATTTGAQTQEQYNLQEETPPPLPPRTHSLTTTAAVTGAAATAGSVGVTAAAVTPTTTLPMAPSAGGVLTLNLRAANEKIYNDDIFIPNNGGKHGDGADGDNNIADKNIGEYEHDTLKAFLNNEISNGAIEAELSSLSNRPLPPLPNRLHNALDRVHESNSDSDDDNDNVADDTDDDEDDDIEESDASNMSDRQQDNEKSTAELNAEQKKNKLNRNEHDDVNANNENEHTAELTKSNGVVENNCNTSPDNELKRRKRKEYQNNLEQKVNEIKRKQRENEEGKQTAKKRRSLLTYIAAGVVVGVIAVYAYSKLG